MASRRYGFDEDKITRFQKEGRGQGRGASYKPWLTIRDVASHGRSHRIAGIKTSRVHHFLSDIERDVFYLFDWAEAVTDIREQYPLDRERSRRISADLDIKHPRDAATEIVMTTDFLVDISLEGKLIQLARAVKPVIELEKPRVIEKLEIERRYWVQQGVDWGIITERDIPEAMVTNIAWLHPYITLDQLTAPYDGYYQEKARLLLRALPSHSATTLRQFCLAMDEQLAMHVGDSLLLIRHLLVQKVISCPMDTVITETWPLHLFQVPSDESRSAIG